MLRKCMTSDRLKVNITLVYSYKETGKSIIFVTSDKIIILEKTK